MGMLTFKRMREAAESGGGAAEKSFDEMTVKELRAYADEHGIDLAGAKKKDEIVAAIEAAESGGGAADGE